MVCKIGVVFVMSCVFLVGTMQGARAVVGLSDYWSYHDFIKEHVDEKEKAINFAKRVRDKGEIHEDERPLVRVAMIYPGKEASDYWYRSASSFEARMRELNLAYEIHPFFSKNGTNALRVQESQIAQALETDPDYLIFTLDVFRHRTLIERILTRGRPKLILQNITTPVRSWGKDQPFLYVGFDHVVGSEMLVEEYLNRFPNDTSYALFYGPRGYVSAMRGDTFKDKVSVRTNAKEVASYYVGYNREKAKKAALNLFKNEKNVSFIYACSTAISLGIIDAAKELNRLDDIQVNGWGGGSKELLAIEKGELDFTVMRMNDDNGVAMADAISLDVDGRTNEVPTVYSGDMILVKKDVDIEKLKKRAFRYSDHWQTKTDTISIFRGTNQK